MHLKDGVPGVSACANNPCLPTFLANFRSAADMVTRPSEAVRRTRLNGRSTDDQPSEEHRQWVLLVTCREATDAGPPGASSTSVLSHEGLGCKALSCGADRRPRPALDAINLIAVHFALRSESETAHHRLRPRPCHGPCRTSTRARARARGRWPPAAVQSVQPKVQGVRYAMHDGFKAWLDRGRARTGYTTLAWARADERPHCNTSRGSGLDPLT